MALVLMIKFSKSFLRPVLIFLPAVLVAVWLGFFIFGGYGIAEKFLFTADVSDIVSKRNYLTRSESVSFTLSNYPYKLDSIANLYFRIAKENGWNVDRAEVSNPVSEKERIIKITRPGQSLTIKIIRVDSATTLSVLINHNK